MSVKSFKFVSPGVFINEIDNSQLPRLPDQLGPVLIGRAERGPAMVPVQVESFSEFVEIFGEPIGGGEASDTWRNGNRMGPTYAAFAAQAYLNSSSPLTFVRLLGDEASDKEVGQGEAGWSVHGAELITLSDVSGSQPYAIIYHTDGVTGFTATQTGNNKEFQITLQGAGTATQASVASTSFEIAEEWADAMAPAFDTTNNIAGGGNVLSLHLQDSAAAPQSVEVKFSLDLQHAYDSANAILTVGLAGGVGAVDVATKIAEAINAVGASLNIVASSNGRKVTLVCEDTGANAALDAAGLEGMGNAQAPNAFADCFKAITVIAGGGAQGAAVDKVFTVSTDISSKKYIRNVLNTNPTLMNDDITDTEAGGASEKYFLGPTFDQAINRHLDVGNPFTNAATSSLTAGYKGVQKPMSAPATPWVKGQWLGDPGTYTEQELIKLFRVHSLYAGEWEQKNFKISISDIALPKNSYTKYGTFSLEVRKVADTDARPEIVERFTGLTLDPSSPSYIGAKIGDMSMVWDTAEQRYRSYGTHLNQSKYVRIEASPDVESGAVNPELLPFAFDLMKDAVAPDLCLRLSTKGSSRLGAATDAYFGLSTDRTASTDADRITGEVHDESYSDMIRTIQSAADPATYTQFSLDLSLIHISEPTRPY